MPGTLISDAVIVLPAASTIENVSGFTQNPFVVARKKPPEAPTTVGEIVIACGNDGVTVYGGVPPKM